MVVHWHHLFRFATFRCEVGVARQFLLHSSELAWRFHFAQLKLKDNFQRCLRARRNNKLCGRRVIFLNLLEYTEIHNILKRKHWGISRGKWNVRLQPLKQHNAPLFFAYKVPPPHGRKNSIQQRERARPSGDVESVCVYRRRRRRIFARTLGLLGLRIYYVRKLR